MTLGRHCNNTPVYLPHDIIYYILLHASLNYDPCWKERINKLKNLRLVFRASSKIGYNCIVAYSPIDVFMKHIDTYGEFKKAKKNGGMTSEVYSNIYTMIFIRANFSRRPSEELYDTLMDHMKYVVQNYEEDTKYDILISKLFCYLERFYNIRCNLPPLIVMFTMMRENMRISKLLDC